MHVISEAPNRLCKFFQRDAEISKLPYTVAMRHATLITTLFLLLHLTPVFGAYYDTLPKNVRMIGLGYVHTGVINSSYGQNRDQFDYFIRQDLNAAAVSDAHPALSSYFNELKRIDPEAYNAFSFGEYEGSGEAEVNVKGFGLAYGITNRLTTFGIVPLYSAEVRMNVARTAGNNYQEVQEILNKHGNSNDTAYLMSQITASFPDASGSLLQSIMINKFGYQPVGNWSATGFGDIELGVLYRLTDMIDQGAAVSGGIILPTGRIDDPDILQDTGFGDGQADIFGEIGTGVTLFKGKLELDTSLRYAYQLPSTKTLRVPDNEVFTLSERKGEFKEKLGNRIEYSASSNWNWNDWFATYGRYTFEHTGTSTYDSEYTEANRILALNSDREIHMFGGGVKLTTTTLYQKGVLAAPLSLDLSARTMVAGRNTPKYSRYELNIKLFF